ncbi:MAG: 4-(cytidine 5'-diphospho)-2-C-methyl-D-erythritol kinase [Spirochaetes bacterium]|nr:4-(cytidine 5'-diphospho)-2-C-methyl-D-erythritol kinase [Spirochaetota bacterium]
MLVLDKQLTFFAPAKVNLHLTVGGRRADGFHNIESIFIKTDFGDTLSFLPVDGNNVEIDMEFEEDARFTEYVNFTEDAGYTDSPLSVIPQEKNIIYKVAALFRNKTGFERGLIIKVKKRIPAGSGLGGGSSDAAGTLLVLNKMAGFPLTSGALLEMSGELGSDVPFFTHGAAAAWVTGRGECIKPLKTPRLFLTLAAPGFPSGTAAAFRLLDNYRQSFASGERGDIYIEHTAPLLHEINLAVVNNNLLDYMSGNFYNDFLPVFSETEKTAYNGIIMQLKELGAEYAGLSGSGSACFGVFKEKAQADNAASVLAKKCKFVKSCTAG